jgi:hypothetical protein
MKKYQWKITSETTLGPLLKGGVNQTRRGMGKRRNAEERKQFHTLKMTWVSELCADPFLTDQEFRTMYGLLVVHYGDETDWCGPKDDTLARTCAKSGRTIRRITSALKNRYLNKGKRLGASRYSFPLLQDRSTLTGLNETRPANFCTKTGHLLAGQNLLLNLLLNLL